MKNKNKIGLIISGFALIVVTGFCVLTTASMLQWLKSQGPGFALINNDTVAAESKQQLSIDAGDLEKVSVVLSNGNITVIPTEGQEIKLELTKTAWGSSTEQAEARLKNLNLDQTISGNSLELSFEPQSNQYAFSFGNTRRSVIDIVIYLPSGLETRLQTWIGDISVRDYQGEMSINSTFGDVSVERFIGKLGITHSNGNLTLKDIDARGEEVEIFNNFGEVRLEDFTADALSYNAQGSSSLIVRNLHVTGDCEFTNRFSPTQITDFACGSFSLQTNSSTIDLEDGNVTADVNIQFDFATLTMTQVVASSYELTTNSGILTADYMQGKITITSGFGNIEIQNAEMAVLDIQTQSGAVSFSGSLDPDAAQTISTTMGEVSVSVPADSAFDLKLETRFGTIDTDFQIMLTGGINAQQVEGSINGGGPLFSVTSENANINFNILEPGN